MLVNTVATMDERATTQFCVRDAGEGFGAECVGVVAREREARARAEAANRRKDDFLAVVAHELRNPLHSMAGWMRLLRSGRLDGPNADRAIESIERGIKAQTRLVEDLLDYSRVINGRLRLELRETDVVPIIEAAVDAMSPAAEEKGVYLNATLFSCAGRVMADPLRLQQVVCNLLSNALKFTARGGGVLIESGYQDSDAQIKVTDTGQGIEPGYLPFVFERFSQGEHSAYGTATGLGLGLSIVKQIVELHGGSVSAQSPGAGKGTTFIVRLPLCHTRCDEGGADFRLPESDSVG
jgi:signal transduction histidine kinase